MAARPAVVLEVPSQDPEERDLAEDDDVVQTLPPNHEMVRSWEMGSMLGMGMGGMGGGGMTTGHCVQNADGSYTMQP